MTKENAASGGTNRRVRSRPKLLRKYCKRSQGVPDVDKRRRVLVLYTRLADRPQQVRPVFAYHQAEPG